MKRLLTGDRPTGKLHLGHFVGSLKNRVKLQDTHECFIIIADYQVLTDHLDDTQKIKENIQNIVLDYLSVGIDPDKNVIFVQSQVPQIAELTMILSMLVNVSELERNPTIKEEFKNSGNKQMTYGFLGYPVSQIADILIFKADCVPVGEDQLPHIELTKKIAKKFNTIFTPIFPIPEPLLSETPKLFGLDGRKMGKSLNNAIYLSDSEEEVNKKIKVAKSNAGNPNECIIYEYYKTFSDTDDVYEKCCDGSLRCQECKNKTSKLLNDILKPIRERRTFFNPKSIDIILEKGKLKAQKEAEKTLAEVKKAIHFN